MENTSFLRKDILEYKPKYIRLCGLTKFEIKKFKTKTNEDN